MTIAGIAIFMRMSTSESFPVEDGLRSAVGVDVFIPPGTKRNPAEWSAR
jgi:hypothetical protein